MKKIHLLLLLPMLFLFACDGGGSDNGHHKEFKAEVQKFLDDYTTEYTRLYYESSEAEWASNTMIVEGDSTNALATRAANEAFAEFTGSEENINKAREYLERKNQLDDIVVRQLESILYSAADNPQTVPDLVKERIKAETEQNENLFGYDFQIDGKSVTPNEIDRILREEDNVNTRLKAWESSKAVGTNLKDGLVNLRNLRNQTVQALGYDDYYTYQVSDYGMDVAEMNELMDQTVREIWPLYRELHTWTRYELAGNYKEEVPEYLPAHWLPNRWGQDWSALVEVEGIDLDGVLKEKGPEWLTKQSERFYVSLGFEELPQSFWDKSSLYPLPDDAEFKKNNHASAWHLDLDHDVRSLMSVEANSEWYETTHHEYGHIYYFLEYTNPEVPPLLRGGANRGFHEAFGSMMGLAAMQKPFMEGLELIPPGTETDEISILHKEALNYIVFIPFGAGVMPGFEHDIYKEDLSADEFNKRWWDLKKKYQGIVPPSERGEEFCDAASKTHINNDAAQYYDYAISYVLLFQFHDHIAKKILNQSPRATNYYGNKGVGDFLKKVMYPGASQDWRTLMEENLGSGMSASPMLEYFEPLMEHLKKENEGRTHTLPEAFPG